MKDGSKAASNTLAYRQDCQQDPGTAEISIGDMAWENPPIEEQDGDFDGDDQ